MDQKRICPGCRQEMQPTRFKEVRDQQGNVIRRIELDWDCPTSCQHTWAPDRWSAAVSAFAKESGQAIVVASGREALCMPPAPPDSTCALRQVEAVLPLDA